MEPDLRLKKGPTTTSPNSLILASDGKFCIGGETYETVSCEEGELVKRRGEEETQ